MDTRPVWVRAKTAREMYGLSRIKINALVALGLVDARRDGGVVIYKSADIEKAIEQMPKYE